MGWKAPMVSDFLNHKGCWNINGKPLNETLNILIDMNGKNVYNFLWKFFCGYLITCFPLTCQKTMPRLEDHPYLKRTLLINFLPILSC